MRLCAIILHNALYASVHIAYLMSKLKENIDGNGKALILV